MIKYVDIKVWVYKRDPVLKKGEFAIRVGKPKPESVYITDAPVKIKITPTQLDD